MRVATILAGPALFAGQEAQAAALASGGGVEVSAWRVIGALIFCLALAAGGLFALRKRLPSANVFFGMRGGGRFELVEHLPLGPQRSLYLIRIDGREFIAVASAERLELVPLGESTAEPES